MLNARTSNGGTLLHLASGAENVVRSTDICRILIQTLPELLSVQDNNGNFPFELACAFGIVDVVECILDSHPEVVEYECNGWPVLFHILFSSYRTEIGNDVAFFVLNKLLQSNPEIVRDARTVDGGTLLHSASGAENIARATDICRVLVGAFPCLLYERDIEGFTPLHIACKHVRLQLVKCILEKSPEAIYETTSSGMTPIMCAEENLTEKPRETIELTKYLLEIDPSVASTMLNDLYQLHYICIFTDEPYLNAGLEVIKLLYDAFPRALIELESNFRSLIENGELVDAVANFLLNQLRFTALTSNVELLTTPEDSGDLPIHSALQHSGDVSFGTIKLMVETSSATLQVRNGNGSLPLHIACASHDCLKVVKYLLDHDRRSLFVTNNEGDTPLHCACRAAKHEIISMIFSDYSNVPVTTRNLNGELPIGLLLCEDEESAGYLGSIYRLVRADPLILF